MAESDLPFQIKYGELIVDVTEHYIKEQRVFRLLFSDNRKPLVITVAESHGKRFWTSIPQGRQKEAEQIGREIALYYKRKKEQ